MLILTLSCCRRCGPDALSLRMMLRPAVDTLKSFKSVTVIKQHSTGIEIETPRYRKLTHLLAEMALEWQISSKFQEMMISVISEFKIAL